MDLQRRQMINALSTTIEDGGPSQYGPPKARSAPLGQFSPVATPPDPFSSAMKGFQSGQQRSQPEPGQPDRRTDLMAEFKRLTSPEPAQMSGDMGGGIEMMPGEPGMSLEELERLNSGFQSDWY